MPKKLRRMQGDLKAKCTKDLIHLIETQSKRTLHRWCMDYATQYMLPLLEERCPYNKQPRLALQMAEDYAAGRVTWKQASPVIWYDDEWPDERDPVALAAEKAIEQAASFFHSPTSGHSLGFYFYGAAALAYARLGLSVTPETYTAEAEKVCLEMTAALREIAVENEPKPVKTMFGC